MVIEVNVSVYAIAANQWTTACPWFSHMDPVGKILTSTGLARLDLAEISYGANVREKSHGERVIMLRKDNDCIFCPKHDS